MANRSKSAGIHVNHLVLNVRDIEASHRFWTEVMRWEQCGELGDQIPLTMHFYRSDPSHHHDIAIVQMQNPDAEGPAQPWNLMKARTAINHFAIAYPDAETWMDQLKHLKEVGQEFHMRVDHGMTHSAYISDPDGNGIEVLYELPDEVWSGDVNAALNYVNPLPVDGPEAFQDDTNFKVFSKS